jgi:hypothetical protein
MPPGKYTSSNGNGSQSLSLAGRRLWFHPIQEGTMADLRRLPHRNWQSGVRRMRTSAIPGGQAAHESGGARHRHTVNRYWHSGRSPGTKSGMERSLRWECDLSVSMLPSARVVEMAAGAHRSLTWTSRRFSSSFLSLFCWAAAAGTAADAGTNHDLRATLNDAVKSSHFDER